MILHLGVIDLPYTKAPGRRASRSVTTGDVATFLENRYHVMEVFYLENEQPVADAVAESLQGAVESLLMGGPPTLDPFGGAASKIEDIMKQFVATGQIETVGIAGVPTQASIDRASGRRRSARFKRRRATGASVSFVDSGLYNTSMKAWID